MLGISWTEWLGYFASVMVLISLLNSSIIRLRTINLIGSVLFSVYGFMIHSIPTGAMNTIIALINVIYLVKIITRKEYFTLLPILPEDKYLEHFMDYYKVDIKKYYPHYSFDQENDICIYILRNLVTAGLLIGKRIDDDTVLIALEYVTPEYRDFKVAKYIFIENSGFFIQQGIRKFAINPVNPDSIKYLRKIGFTDDHGKSGQLIKYLK